MPYAETQKACETLKAQFNNPFDAAYPNSVETLQTHNERMLTFYRFPKEPWVHLLPTTCVVVEATIAYKTGLDR